MPTREELKQLQSLPLDIKIMKTQQRIREWVNYYGVNGVYVSFSGGKDSTVLLHLVRQLYPSIKAVFSDTGLEFPEIRDFVKTVDNVDWVKPEKTFKQIILGKGYPLFSKEIAETIWFARKIVGGGGQPYCTETNLRERDNSQTLGTYQQTNCRRKKLQGVFRWATGREQVNL